jgi:hypothetical protein
MKAEKLEELIMKCRDQIQHLWAQLRITDEEKSSFTPYWDGIQNLKNNNNLYRIIY